MLQAEGRSMTAPDQTPGFKEERTQEAVGLQVLSRTSGLHRTGHRENSLGRGSCPYKDTEGLGRGWECGEHIANSRNP